MIERKDNNKPNIKSDKRSFTKADRQAGNAKGIRSGGALSRVLRKAGQAIGLIEDDETKAASIQRSDGRVLDLKENIVEGMGIGEHQGKLTELVYEGVDVSDESKMNELVYEAIEAAETDSTVSKITFVETAEFAEGFAKSKAELIVESFSERFDLVEDFTPTYKPAIRESFQEDVQVQETFIVNALLAIRENFIEYMSIAEGFLQRVPGYIQESFIAVSYTHLTLPTNREV
nr:hypothetical protein 4 [Balneolaceae bacterium]